MPTKSEPKFRRRLNDKQLAVLELMYVYRFASRQLLAHRLNVKHVSSLHRTLETLSEQGYVGKHYDKSYRLRGKPAAYYITPKTVRYFQTLPKNKGRVTDGVIKASYRDKLASEDYVDHVVTAFNYIQLIQDQHANVSVLGKRQLRVYDYMPKELPDACVLLRSKKPEDTQFFFFDYLPANMPRYLIKRRLKDYETYFDEGDWEAATDQPIPTLLFCTDDPKGEQRLRRVFIKQLEQMYADFRIYTSNAVTLSSAKDTKVWTLVDETADEDELQKPVALVAIPRMSE